jgi:hypothetical protein
VVYLPFEENDMGTGSNMGTIWGNYTIAKIITSLQWASQSPGIIGKSLSLNANNYISIASHTGINFWTGDFTLSTWVKFNDFTYPKSYVLINKTGTGVWNGWNACYKVNATTPRAPGWAIGHSFQSGISNCYSDGTILGWQDYIIGFDTQYRPIDTLWKWHHFAAIISWSNKTITYYINGVKQSVVHTIDPLIQWVDNNQPLIIGHYVWWKNDASYDEFRIFNTALTEAEILTLSKK